jgi:hypothetical protein
MDLPLTEMSAVSLHNDAKDEEALAQDLQAVAAALAAKDPLEQA